MGLINTQYLIHQSSSFQELAARFVPYFKGPRKRMVVYPRSPAASRDGSVLELVQKHDRQAQGKRVLQACHERISNASKAVGRSDIPVFILPVNESSREIREQFYYQSGMAFDDKVFLFVSKYPEGANRYIADSRISPCMQAAFSLKRRKRLYIPRYNHDGGAR